jgi:hypothetical protein
MINICTGHTPPVCLIVFRDDESPDRFHHMAMKVKILQGENVDLPQWRDKVLVVIVHC